MLMFSATMPPEIGKIAQKYMHDPQEFVIGTRNEGAANVRHIYYMVNARDKYLALKRIADNSPNIYAIVFCRTRRETQEVADNLIHDGYNADALHGDLSQQQRDIVMKKFRDRVITILVATDVAARGLDVDPGAYNRKTALLSGRPDRARRSRREADGEISARSDEETGMALGRRPCETGALARIQPPARILQRCPENRLHRRDKDRRTASKGMERIYINVGKRDGFYAGNLIEMLNSLVGGKRVDVGRIDLMPSYSLFDVKKSDARRVVASLKGSDFMGKRVYSEVAEQDKDYAKASQRRSKGKDAAADTDPYDAFELFKKKARKRK